MMILVTGGSGQVGKHLRELIPSATYMSSRECDLTDRDAVDYMLHNLRPDTVVHLAAKVGGITDNVSLPCDYFQDNIMMNTVLLDSCRRHGVDRFIGMLSTCMYPDALPEHAYPLDETYIHEGPPTATNFGYGYAKRCMAVHVDAMNKQHGTRYQYLVPTNLYGPYDKFDERAHFVGALLRKLKESKDGKIHLLGDGTPLRQFMYAGDLAMAVFLCIIRNVRESFNVAPDENLSIKEIAETAIAVIAPGTTIEWEGKQFNGQHRKDAYNGKMKALLHDLEITPLAEGLKQTWDIINGNN